MVAHCCFNLHLSHCALVSLLSPFGLGGIPEVGSSWPHEARTPHEESLNDH